MIDKDTKDSANKSQKIESSSISKSINPLPISDYTPVKRKKKIFLNIIVTINLMFMNDFIVWFAIKWRSIKGSGTKEYKYLIIISQFFLYFSSFHREIRHTRKKMMRRNVIFFKYTIFNGEIYTNFSHWFIFIELIFE
jgi:hypothetical protein